MTELMCRDWQNDNWWRKVFYVQKMLTTGLLYRGSCLAGLF